MNTLSYVTVDVFTSTRFEGNPLAVIPDARGLSDAAMQKIATEFRYSEVTFVLPPEDPQNSARVRIFTPTMEIPFAGHPNVGTAYVLGQQAEIFGKPVGDTLRFEEKAGIVEVSLKRERRKGCCCRHPRAAAADDRRHHRRGNHRPLRLDRPRRHRQHHPCPGLCLRRAELSPSPKLDELEALATARPNLAGFQAAAGRQTTSGHDFSLFLYVRQPKIHGIFAPACSRRSTTSPKTRQPAAPQPRLAPISSRLRRKPT